MLINLNKNIFIVNPNDVTSTVTTTGNCTLTLHQKQQKIQDNSYNNEHDRLHLQHGLHCFTIKSLNIHG